MVKNNTGGNKSKKMARKTVPTGGGGQDVRRVTDSCEMYAAITKIYSSKRCDVIGTDGKTRACTIRGKFLGRKRNGDGTIAVGAWVMIGFYDWEVRGDGSKTCDLLEVYTQNEKEKLKQLDGQHLSAIMGIGELEGTENEFIFSAFHQTAGAADASEAAGASEAADASASASDEDADAPDAALVRPVTKAVVKDNNNNNLHKPTHNLHTHNLATHMQKINMAKKETPNEQLDWLNIKVEDI
jgi:hypothetical protein